MKQVDDLSAVPTLCYMCSSECGLRVTADQAGVKIKGNPLHPVNRGKVCPKITSAIALLKSPDRLITPKKRVGARGKGQFIDISWQQAFSEIADKLKQISSQYSSEALTMLFGEKPDHDVAYLFSYLYGTPNILDHNSLCDSSKRLAFSLCYGEGQERPLPDLQRPAFTSEGYRRDHDCKLLVLIGENPADAKRYFWFWEGICEAKRQGMTLVVIDPFQTRAAQAADLWLPIRPGTDVSLLLFLLKSVIDCNAIDELFVEKYIEGFDRLKQELSNDQRHEDNDSAPYGLNWACRMTGLEPDALTKLADLVCTVKPMIISVGKNGVSHQYSGFCSTRLVAIITALTGNLDIPGGMLLRDTPRYRSLANHTEFLTAAQKAKHKDRNGRYPLARHGVVSSIPSDVLDGVKLTSGEYAGGTYQTKALIVTHGNPLVMAPDRAVWVKAFCERQDGEYKLSLLVFNDTSINDTGLFADYLLPMRHFLERQGVTEHESAIPVTGLRQVVTSPPEMTLSPLAIYQSLARAFEQPSKFEPLLNIRDDDEWCDKVLGRKGATSQLRKQGGLDIRPIRYRKYLSEPFATASGKIEFYPEQIEKRQSGIIDQRYVQNEQEQYQRFQSNRDFRLVTGRLLKHVHSMTQHLINPVDSPFVWMNNQDAADLKLKQGDEVELRSSDDRAIRVIIKPTSAVRRGVIRALHGWGGISSRVVIPHNYNVNELINISHLHPLSGNATYGCVWIKLNHIVSDE